MSSQSPTDELPTTSGGLSRAAAALVERVLTALEEDAESLGGAMARATVAEVEEVAVAARNEPGLEADFAKRCKQSVRTLVAVAREGRSATPYELAFVHEIAMRRAIEGFPLEVLLRAIRIGNRVIWQRMAEAAGNRTGSAEALAWLTAQSLRHGDELSTTMAGTYTRTLQARAADVERMRHELLDEVLAGRFPSRPESIARAAALGFSAEDSYFVLVATARDHPSGPPAPTPEDLRAALERATANDAPRPLVVGRGREVIAVASAGGGAGAMAQALANELGPAAAAKAAIGVSSPCRGLQEVARCYAEAYRALALVREGGGIAALDDIRLFDYLAAQIDLTAHRLLPAGFDALVDHTPGREALAGTLQAYLDCNLGVPETARRLSVHPNTVRYRLARIEEITGLDTRRFWDLAELAAALRIAARRHRED